MEKILENKDIFKEVLVILSYFNDTNDDPNSFDLIATGDLGVVGSKITLDLLKECYDIKVCSYGSHFAFMSTKDIFKSYLDFWKIVKM